jgi:CRISPR-associated protein Cst1
MSDMPSTENGRMSLTGNPFVDTGLAVVAALANLDDVEHLSLDTVRRVYGNGSQLASWNSRLKSFSQIFGTNNPLFQNGYGYQKGKGPSELNLAIYCETLSAFVEAASTVNKGFRCEACGSLTDFDFAQACISVVGNHGKKAPEDKWVGRDWFPLAGSLGSDAQALPAASRPVRLCAKCLFAVHYLPLGLILLDGRLAVFQSSSVEFWYDLVRDIVTGDGGTRSRVMAGLYETPGAREGNRAVAKRLLDLFRRLLRAKDDYDLPKGTALSVWRFTNSGASPDCKIEEIPNPTLIFLLKAARNNLDREVEHIIDSEKKRELSLFRCITEQRDYPGLYPRGKWLGASPKLFALYQAEVCARSPKVLEIARTLARQAAEGLKPKDLKRIQREEAFSERAVRNQFRGLMVSSAQESQFTLDDYIGLFPLRDDVSGISVHFDGWNLIRYYLHHLSDSEPFAEISTSQTASPTRLATLRYYAARIFSGYIEERGKARFHSEVLSRMIRGEISVSWLENQFTRLAEKHTGFTYGAWNYLCKNDDGQLFIGELLFQMRLLWTEWMQTDEVPVTETLASQNGSGLPVAVETCLRTMFSRYVAQRGLERFYRDVLMRLRRNEIGLAWLRRWIVRQENETPDAVTLSQEDWEELLKDDEGRPCSRERQFQMHLLMANLYREAK